MARIVLIDDEARLLQTLTRFLEIQGHQVIRGESFAEVESHLRPGAFELLISDIVMPDFNGIRVLEEVVNNRHCLEPVILITGEPNLETASQAVRVGAFDYITKPVTKDKLLEAVSRALRHVQLLRERDQARRTEIQILKNLAMIGESASVLTHEIRTPITSLRQALRAVGDKLGMGDRALVEELVHNLNHIERLLGQTLSLAKPLVLAPRPMAMQQVLGDACRQAQALPILQQMRVQIVVGPEVGVITVDPQLFGEVISNLLRNAAEACGGAGNIEITARLDGPKVVVDVTDDGPGVPANKREEIFKPFHSSKSGGTGIGLAFCRKVIESHGGTIGLCEGPGPGACFRIEVPRDDHHPNIATDHD
jgi:signal transduction histidine kinase